MIQDLSFKVQFEAPKMLILSPILCYAYLNFDKDKQFPWSSHSIVSLIISRVLQQAYSVVIIIRSRGLTAGKQKQQTDKNN